VLAETSVVPGFPLPLRLGASSPTTGPTDPEAERHDSSIEGFDKPADAALPTSTHPTMTIYPGSNLNIEQLVSALAKAVIKDNGELGR